MPTAGIGLACSVYSSVVARRGRTTAPSRLPDQGLHRFRPAEALLKKRELMTGKMQMSGLLVALSAVALVGRAKETMAADFTVNSTVDAVDASPGDGLCATVGGWCTLRAAVQETNARPGTQSIRLPAGTYVLAIPGADEDASVTGDLDITDDLTITGAGAGVTIVDGGHLDRAFHVVRHLEGPTVQISGITVQNGLVLVDPSGGGGILTSGTLALNRVALLHNSADYGGGAATDPGAVLAITDSTVSGNTAATNAGGLLNFFGTLTVTRTTVSGNSAGVDAGGLGGPGNTVVVSSLVTGNHAGGQCGGIGEPPAPATALTVHGSTISGNTAMLNGGGITVASTFAISDTVVSDNFAQRYGGGILIGGPLQEPLDFLLGGGSTITGSTVINNSAALDGGGIFQFAWPGVPVTISGSVVSGNAANAGPPFGGAPQPGVGLGGGIFIRGTMEVIESTVSENSSAGGGGIAVVNGTLDLINSTISGNAATTDGGGIASDTGTIRLNNVTTARNTADSDGDGIGDGGGLASVAALVSVSNTIIADNVDVGGEAPDCASVIDSRGYNLIENGAHCLLVGGPADITGHDPRLGPLETDGAGTPTHALLRGSPAVDTGNPAQPGSGGNACEANDQRGISRPQDGNGDGVALCDIGAFEKRR